MAHESMYIREQEAIRFFCQESGMVWTEKATFFEDHETSELTCPFCCHYLFLDKEPVC